jgi:hypothetical protein
MNETKYCPCGEMTTIKHDSTSTLRRDGMRFYYIHDEFAGRGCQFRCRNCGEVIEYKTLLDIQPTHTYYIKTVSDFLLIPQEKIGVCIAEFVIAIETARIMKNMNETLNPGASFKWPTFIWKDDDKREIKIKLTKEKP